MLDAIRNLQHSPSVEGEENSIQVSPVSATSVPNTPLTTSPEHLTTLRRKDVLQTRPSSELQAAEVSNCSPLLELDYWTSTTSLEVHTWILHLLSSWAVGSRHFFPFPPPTFSVSAPSCTYQLTRPRTYNLTLALKQLSELWVWQVFLSIYRSKNSFSSFCLLCCTDGSECETVPNPSPEMSREGHVLP